MLILFHGRRNGRPLTPQQYEKLERELYWNTVFTYIWLGLTGLFLAVLTSIGLYQLYLALK